jgi:mannose-6-phosphate isomerase-like protein (cupin superfamily)
MDSVNIRPPGERTYGLEHIAVGADVRVSALSLAGDECVEWHWHSKTSDIFFCLEGVAIIEMRNPSKLVHVNIGDRYDVLPGVAHRVTPLDGKKCRLVLVQGVGKADFHRGSHDSQ